MLTTRKKSLWTEENLRAAISAVESGISSYKASEQYGVPRRTLRDYLRSGGVSKRQLGRKSVFTKTQEADFVKRIIRFAELGIPLTGKMICKQAFVFCERHNIANKFNKDKRFAGKDWLKLFLKRNPTVAKRKAQFLNHARGQKLNKNIVAHHFKEVKKLYDELGIHYNPERLYNMDEKGCRLTMHKQPTVLAEKGAKRVHLQASEHGENVTIVGCANAVGNPIPPMIIFKGIRKKTEFEQDLPPGSIVRMAPKGSMTTELFIDFLAHLAKYKTAGKCLLVFDGAKCHLDFRIVEEADKYDITLYCLPSNTTQELQPLDKSCYKPFESYWDREVLEHLYKNHAQKLSKTTFNAILSKVWSQCMTLTNITSGFRATGLYPFNPNVIPESAYAPSTLTERPQAEQDNLNHSRASSPIMNSRDLEILVNSTNHVADHTPDLSPIASPSIRRNRVVDDVMPDLSPIASPNAIEISYPEGMLTPPRNHNQNRDFSPFFSESLFMPAISKLILQSYKTASAHHQSPTSNNTSPIQMTSGLQTRKGLVDYSSSTESSECDLFEQFIHRQRPQKSLRIYSSSESEDENQIVETSVQDNHENNNSVSDDEDNTPLAHLSDNKTAFHKFMPTPNYAAIKNKPRRKALNYQGQRVTKDLFTEKKETTKKTILKKRSAVKKTFTTKKATQKKQISKVKNGKKKTERKARRKSGMKKAERTTKFSKRGKENNDAQWYCHACAEDRVADMRSCVTCMKWYHEECIGLTKDDKEEFTCLNGCD
ncbi:hypothetical protein O0L34_g2477 [Tuta absoluta]|nr:hypothetical protein O0L34_g2477 [Tuta absoluta]